VTICWTCWTTFRALRTRPTTLLAKAINPVIPTTKPTRLLNANNNTTATINHRHRAPTQSTRVSFQSCDSSPEIVMILGSRPWQRRRPAASSSPDEDHAAGIKKAIFDGGCKSAVDLHRVRKTVLDSWAWLGATEGWASCRLLGRGDRVVGHGLTPEDPIRKRPSSKG